jgi:hypothetical protein
VVVVHVDGVRICLSTAANNWPIIHLPDDMSEESNDGILLTGETEELGKKNL